MFHFECPYISRRCNTKSKKSCQEIKIALKDSFVEIYVIEKKHRNLIIDAYADMVEANLWT
jgi:hypothetical protein